MKHKPDFSSLQSPDRRIESDCLLTTRDAARLLAIGVGTMKFWRCRKHDAGPDFIRVGGRIRYSPEALRRYIRMRTVRVKPKEV